MRLIALMATLLIAGCANPKPFEPHPIDEIPQGRGLLSGEDGEFVIYRKKDQSENTNSKKRQSTLSQ